MARKGKEINNIKAGVDFPLIKIFFIITIGIVTLGYLLYNQYKKMKGKQCYYSNRNNINIILLIYK